MFIQGAKWRWYCARTCAVLLLLLGNHGPATSQPVPVRQSPTAVIVVNPQKVLGPTNRQVLGNNALGYLHSAATYSAQGAGLWDPSFHKPVPQMVELARNAGVSSLRWPGGCDVHLFNWKLTVGPLETRPKQPFGLAEFMQSVQEIGADPVITISDYFGTESDAADLVEYLNAPLGQNTNGGIDWAAVRAKQGRASPYGVKWFEFGNETDHGPHQRVAPTTGTAMSADEYANRFRAVSLAIKKIDPNVRLGAVLAADTSFPLSQWNETVIRGTGDVADYFIYHAYLPRFAENDKRIPVEELFDVAFAAGDQFAVLFRRLAGEIKRLTRRDIPLAITEFNGQFVQEQPKPYRLTLGTAVLVADMVFTFLKPESGVVFANYWQMSNEYWGMVRGYQAPYLKRPTFYVFQMLNENLGEQLVETRVQSAGYETKGGFGVLATTHTPSKFEFRGFEQAGQWKTSLAVGASADVSESGVLSVQLPGTMALNYYHARMELPASPGLGYRVTAEIRAEGLSKTGVQLEVADGRGWNATKSSTLSSLVRSNSWTPVTVDYITLPDAKAIDIRLRRLGMTAEGGKIEARNVKVRSFVPDRQAKVPYVSAMSTLSDGRLAVFLVNRNVRQAVQVKVVGVPSGNDSAWVLGGTGVDSDNESHGDAVSPKLLETRRESGAVVATLPPHSFAVLTSTRLK